VGYFYSNITLKGPTQEQLVTYLRHAPRDAYVSPTVDGITVVYDRECESLHAEVLHQVTTDLSRTFACPALAAYLFDDDVFWYALYQRGCCVDTYNSEPAYFDESVAPEPSGGDAALLCAAFACDPMTHEMDALLHFAPLTEDEHGDLVIPEGFLPAEQQHAALARVLGLPTYAYGMGYYSIDSGHIPAKIDLANWIKTGA
jgi:hypothetical protein